MIFTYCPNDFWHKRKINNFDPYNVFLAIAKNIPQRLKTDFVVQGHILFIYLFNQVYQFNRLYQINVICCT